MAGSFYKETRANFITTDGILKVIPSFCNHANKHERRTNITEEMVGDVVSS